MERRPKKLYYKIGEACKALDIQPYVLRYWETEFAILSPSKSKSGQRVYTERELEVIRRIKELLYDEGYTIAGAKKKLEAEMSAPAGKSEAPAVKGETPAPARSERARPPRSAATAAEPAALRSSAGGGEGLQDFRQGIEKALKEARHILALLEVKPPPR
ncbi:MAG TPA: MerR family transcriptional regulator [Thermoanaerobaculia bacterium]|nr:MerR family transcriptional regulator [Thermoanaerobaculia bacterium]